MAGLTKGFSLRLKHQRIVGTVAEVAGSTLTILNWLMDIRFQKFRLQAGVAGVTDIIRPASKNVFRAGTMRIMTAGTHVFREWAMWIFVLVRFRARISVAFVAKISFILIHKACISCGVRRMTRETTFFTIHRSVWKTAHLAGIFVAIETKVVALADQERFIIRGVRIMTRKTVT
jgi:hypothetical protein